MDLKSILDLLHKAVKSAGPINHLIEAGTPVMEAVHQQAPELGAALKELVEANAPPETKPKPAAAPGSGSLHVPVRLSHEEAATAVAKAIFAPQHIEAHEQAWMDRASQSFG